MCGAQRDTRCAMAVGLLPSRMGVPWSCGPCPDAPGQRPHPGSVDLRSPLCPSIAENHGVDERTMRGVCPGSRAGTKLGVCHHHALLHSRLQMQTPAVACGRGVLCQDDLPSLSARIAWKGAFLYNALECAH